MARLGRNCGFYPSGDEPIDVWGLFPAGTATLAPARIPPGVLVSTPVNGNIENDGTHFYVTLNNTRYILRRDFFTATDRILGRVSAGAGAGEEIICTAAGRALLDDADAAAQRTTLGLGDAATKNVGTGAGDVAAGNHEHSTHQGVHKAEDGSAGLTVDVVVGDGAGGTKTLSFKNGLLVAVT